MDEVWDRFVAGRPEAHFGQRSAWRRLMTEHYRVTAQWRAAFEGERMVGILPLFRAPSAFGPATLFSAPGGLLAESPEAAEQLLADARSGVGAGGARWLELRDQAVRWPGLVTSDENATLTLELAPEAETLWKGFDAKLRNQIRKAEKAGLKFAWGHEHVNAFHAVFSENMRDLGTPAMEAGFFRRTLEAYGDDANVVVVFRGDEPVGGMLVVRQGNTVFDPWASSLRRWFPLCPNNLLYWAAIERAASTGATRFDFGRSQPGSGTFRFKEQWGARSEPLYYQYVLAEGQSMPKLSDQKSAFGLAVAIWQRLPLTVTQALGPRVRRLFPEAL